ncbi:MAG: hypothetical protein LBU06_03720, partial [Desulfovibrio sp.]|nr:hypothetical protein [Desulfovibrio sp.]
CSILFGEPQAGKSPPAPHKTCGFGACLAGAIPIPDKIEAIFIWNWHNTLFFKRLIRISNQNCIHAVLIWRLRRKCCFALPLEMLRISA